MREGYAPTNPQPDLASKVQELQRRVRDIETGAQTIRDRKCDEALALMKSIQDQLDELTG